MTGRGPDLFLSLVLEFRQYIEFYLMLFHLSPVLPAIAEDGYLFPFFFHLLMASGPFHSCRYVEVGSRIAGSYLSSCGHSLCTCQLAEAFPLRVVAKLVPSA